MPGDSGRERERCGLERLLAVGFFAALFFAVALVLHWLGPLALNECRQLLARVSNLDPDYEFHRGLSRTVGAYQFQRTCWDRRRNQLNFNQLDLQPRA